MLLCRHKDNKRVTVSKGKLATLWQNYGSALAFAKATHNGLANQNSRIALSNDPVFNNKNNPSIERETWLFSA